MIMLGRSSLERLDVDENPKVAMQYGIMSIPTLLIFKNGRLVDQIIDAMPRRMLEPRKTRILGSLLWSMNPCLPFLFTLLIEITMRYPIVCFKLPETLT